MFYNVEFGPIPLPSGTGSTTLRNASDALPFSRIAFKTVGQEAIPASDKNALILSASKAFSSPFLKCSLSSKNTKHTRATYHFES